MTWALTVSILLSTQGFWGTIKRTATYLCSLGNHSNQGRTGHMLRRCNWAGSCSDLTACSWCPLRCEDRRCTLTKQQGLLLEAAHFDVVVYISLYFPLLLWAWFIYYNTILHISNSVSSLLLMNFISDVLDLNEYSLILSFYSDRASSPYNMCHSFYFDHLRIHSALHWKRSPSIKDCSF